MCQCHLHNNNNNNRFPRKVALFSCANSENSFKLLTVAGRLTAQPLDACPFVQILDAPVPQLGDQVLELLQKIVTASLVELVQVIAVPKISLNRVPPSVLPFVVRRRQKQLVEVPTEPGYSLAGHCRACPGAEGCNGIGGADREQSSSVPQGSAKK